MTVSRPMSSPYCDEFEDKDGSDTDQVKSKWKMLSTPTFVPALEGLRGIAVLMTCLSHIAHAKDRFININGKGGVSIFFVLSGFLITGVLAKQHESTLSSGSSIYHALKKFYMDRSVRLYPALIFMIAVTSITHIYREKIVPKNFALQIFYALTYLTDLHQQTWIGFPVTIWQNLWSLAIEEQFYILWSLLVPSILILNVKRRSYLLLCGIALSALMQYSNTARLGILPQRFCFRENPFFNFWKMLLGAYIRLVPMPSWTRSIWASRSGLILLSGAILTASSATAIDFTMLGFSERYVGYLVYGEWLTAAATMLIILGVVEHGNTILETSFLRFVGRVSYSLYLFQSPLLVFGRSHRTVFSGLSITALALCAGTFSTLYIEEPLREAYKRRYHKIRADGNHPYCQLESGETMASGLYQPVLS